MVRTYGPAGDLRLTAKGGLFDGCCFDVSSWNAGRGEASRMLSDESFVDLEQVEMVGNEMTATGRRRVTLAVYRR